MYFVLFCLLLALCLLVLVWCVRQVIRRGIEQRVIANEALKSIEESQINLKNRVRTPSISSKPDVQIPLRKLNTTLQKFEQNSKQNDTTAVVTDSASARRQLNLKLLTRNAPQTTTADVSIDTLTNSPTKVVQEENQPAVELRTLGGNSYRKGLPKMAD